MTELMLSFSLVVLLQQVLDAGRLTVCTRLREGTPEEVMQVRLVACDCVLLAWHLPVCRREEVVKAGGSLCLEGRCGRLLVPAVGI